MKNIDTSCRSTYTLSDIPYEELEKRKRLEEEKQVVENMEKDGDLVVIEVSDVLKFAKNLLRNPMNFPTESEEDTKKFYEKCLEVVKNSKEETKGVLFICYDSFYAISFFIEVHNKQNYYYMEIQADKEKIEQITQKPFNCYKKINLYDKYFGVIDFEMNNLLNNYKITKSTNDYFDIEGMTLGIIGLGKLKEVYGEKEAEEEIARNYYKFHFYENGNYVVENYFAKKKSPTEKTDYTYTNIELESNKQKKPVSPLVIEELKRLTIFEEEVKTLCR